MSKKTQKNTNKDNEFGKIHKVKTECRKNTKTKLMEALSNQNWDELEEMTEWKG